MVELQQLKLTDNLPNPSYYMLAPQVKSSFVQINALIFIRLHTLFLRI